MNSRRWKYILTVMGGSFLGVLLLCYGLRIVGHARFSQPIADADRIVVTEDGSLESMTITGKKVGEIARVINSAWRDTAQYAAKFSWKAGFYRGTNYLGEVVICCDGLFMANGKQYHAKQSLDDLVVTSFKHAQQFR